MRAEFVALDKLTLVEIEKLFSERAMPSEVSRSILPAPLQRKTGRSYLATPGAVFFELEDLVGTIAK